MTEAELQRKVAELCAQLGLHHYHTHDSRGSVSGFPDSVIVGTKVLYRELKRSDEEPTPAQKRWGRVLKRAGADWSVWRPEDWTYGVIEMQLRQITL